MAGRPRSEAPRPHPQARRPPRPRGRANGWRTCSHVDPLELEIGYRLIALADPTRGGDLLDRIRTVRHRVARDLGLIVPQVRIRDEMGLPPHDYRIKIRGAVVGQGTAYAGRLLAVPPAGLAGPQARRPRRRRPDHRPPGRLDPRRRPRGRRAAPAAGSLEPSAVVAEHFGEIVARHADELMTHEQVGRLLDRARATSPALVDRGRPRPAPRRRGPAGPAEPPPRAGERPRPGDDPRDPRRARRPDPRTSTS